MRRGNVVLYPVFSPENVWKEKREGNLVQMRRAIQATKEAIKGPAFRKTLIVRFCRPAMEGNEPIIKAGGLDLLV